MKPKNEKPSEPQFKRDDKPPRCPRGLHPEAAKRWAEVSPILHEAGVLTVADYGLLERYCRIWADYCTHRKDIEDREAVLPGSGFYQTTPSGYEQVRPVVSQLNKEHDLLSKLESDLGLTPDRRETKQAKPNGKLDKYKR